MQHQHRRRVRINFLAQRSQRDRGLGYAKPIHGVEQRRYLRLVRSARPPCRCSPAVPPEIGAALPRTLPQPAEQNPKPLAACRSATSPRSSVPAAPPTGLPPQAVAQSLQTSPRTPQASPTCDTPATKPFAHPAKTHRAPLHAQESVPASRSVSSAATPEPARGPDSIQRPARALFPRSTAPSAESPSRGVSTLCPFRPAST